MYQNNHSCRCQNKSAQHQSISQYADLSLPIKVRPVAKVSDVEIECCGEPVICCKSSASGCDCELIVQQTICIKIPISYDVLSDVGELSIGFRPNIQRGCDGHR